MPMLHGCFPQRPTATAQPRGDHDRGGHPQHGDWRPGARMAGADWARGQRGYEWREVDGRYVMAAAATGLIASIIAASH
ncbi:MAG: RcnB family protein [Caulobacteraceae bacterium]|nr:RcnB family protein [Caulobacteraceae bacterium]